MDSLVTAYPLCIALADTDFVPWYYENYLEIYSLLADEFLQISYNDGMSYINNEFSPLKVTTVPYDFLPDNMIDMMIRCIDQAYYLVLFVDEYYMKKSAIYLEEHYNHECLLYGYDTNHRIFNAVRFIYGELIKDEVKFDDIAEALNSAKKLDIRFDFSEDHELHLISKKMFKKPYLFCVNRLKSKLKGYRLSDMRPSDLYFRRIKDYNYQIGIDTYDAVVEHVMLCYINRHQYSVNAIRAFYDHKKGVLARLSYVYEQKKVTEFGGLIKEYQFLVSRINNIRRLYFKMSMVKDVTVKGKIKDQLICELLMCKDLDKELIDRVLALI